MDYRITEARKGRVTINGTVASIGCTFVLSIQLRGRERKTTGGPVMDTPGVYVLIIDGDDKVGTDSGMSVGDV